MFSETRYAMNGDLHVAYRTSREGPRLCVRSELVHVLRALSGATVHSSGRILPPGVRRCLNTYNEPPPRDAIVDKFDVQRPIRCARHGAHADMHRQPNSSTSCSQSADDIGRPSVDCCAEQRRRRGCLKLLRPVLEPARTENEGRELKCITCGADILRERAELGFTYCTKPKCVRENREGLTVIEIGQHKTNPEYVIADGDSGKQALKNMREGKYRRDPVVVKRQRRATRFDVPKRKFSQPQLKKYPANRVKFVQALHDQGYGVEDILQKGAYMHLTRSEVARYMSGRRGRPRR